MLRAIMGEPRSAWSVSWLGLIPSRSQFLPISSRANAAAVPKGSAGWNR